MIHRSLISIIIPVYNCAQYLPQCLNSVLSQTYKNLEILLVNDGSTDNGGNLCDEYAQKDTRITVIHQSNAGVSAARNSGLKLAKGEYIGFVDADDYIAPGMYEYLYKLIQQYNVPISVCNFFHVKEEEGALPSACPCPADIHVLTTNQALTFLIKQLFMWNKLFSNQLLENVNFPTDISYGEDMIVLLEVFQRAKRIAYGNKPYYYYRQHERSATVSQKWNPKNLSWIKSTDKILNYAKKERLVPLVNNLHFAQMDLSATFLRNCLINGPFDEKSIQRLRIYFKKNLKEFLCSNIKFSKKAFVLCALLNLNLATKLYKLLDKN